MREHAVPLPSKRKPGTASLSTDFSDTLSSLPPFFTDFRLPAARLYPVGTASAAMRRTELVSWASRRAGRSQPRSPCSTTRRRPDLAAPIYAPAPEQFAVPADAAPLFVVCADDDALVPPDHSVRLYSAWHAAGHPVELHVYAKGGHGFGMKKQGLPVDQWTDRFSDWLKAQGFLKPAQ